MSNRLELHAKTIEADLEPTNSVFDLGRESLDIFNALAAQTPLITETLESVRKIIPLQKSIVANVAGHFYRLPSHNRSFCYSLSQSDSLISSPVLVFKGSEPLSMDFQTMLDWMLQAPLRKSSRVMADHFPLAEGKIPGALSLHEAIREAEIALDVQQRHLRHYGELAKIPTPLLVHAISGKKMDRCVEILQRKLSQPAFDRIDPILKNGLAIYVYYYPSPPVRSNYWGDMGAPQFKKFFEGRSNVDEIVADWARLIVRLLYLGYLPYSVRNEGLGACMDFGNAALDGGFCDVDSITTIDPDMDDEFFRESLLQSISTFQNTVQMMLGLSNPGTLYPSTEEFACRQYVLQLINNAVSSEKKPGLTLDDRFSKLMSIKSIADVKACTTRKNRIPTYANFARRKSPSVAHHSADSYP